MSNNTTRKAMWAALTAIVLTSYYTFALLDGFFAAIFSPGVTTGLNIIAWITLICAPIFMVTYLMVIVLLVEYLVMEDAVLFWQKYKVIAGAMLFFGVIVSSATLLQLKGTGLAFLALQTLVMAIAVRLNATAGSQTLYVVAFYVEIFLILATFFSFGQVLHYRNIMLYATLLGSWIAYGKCASYIRTRSN